MPSTLDCADFAQWEKKSKRKQSKISVQDCLSRIVKHFRTRRSHLILIRNPLRLVVSNVMAVCSEKLRKPVEAFFNPGVINFSFC